MKSFIRISIDPKDISNHQKPSLPLDLIMEITATFQSLNENVYYNISKGQPLLRTRGWIPPTEIIVTLGSAGVFTALYKVICKFLEKNKDRQITVEHENTKINIKGHNLPEERELLRKLFPDWVQDK